MERKPFHDPVALSVSVDLADPRDAATALELAANGEDLRFLTITVLDQDGLVVENAQNYVSVSVEGCGVLLGLDNGDSTDYDEYKGTVRKLFNGKLRAIIGSTTEAGDIRVSVSSAGLRPATLSLTSHPAEVQPGYAPFMPVAVSEATDVVPMRKMALTVIGKTDNGSLLVTPDSLAESPEDGSLCFFVGVKVYPSNTTDHTLVFKVVNDRGIDCAFASVCTINPTKFMNSIPNNDATSDEYTNTTNAQSNAFDYDTIAAVSVKGDGDLRLRCLGVGGNDQVRLISELDFTSQGFGTPATSPYDFVSAGLFNDAIGEIGNGNDKGIATQRGARSGVVFENLDFGDYGSDTLTMSVFALQDEVYPIEVWLGDPRSAESERLTTVSYQKPFRWNVYQEETWVLPRRIKNTVSLCFILQEKAHIKGFYFSRYDKAFSKIDAAECTRVYGDQYVVSKPAVLGIGNNVTLTYENMDFGDEGASFIEIWGASPLAMNTIHLSFTTPAGETVKRMIEFPGSSTESTTPVSHRFKIEPLQGAGDLSFIFLPGSQFDFYAFQLFNHNLS
jgi:beta-galactosidase